MTAAVNTEEQTLAINTIRTLAIDAVQKANSGHPGLPMGAASMAYTLWHNHLRHNPKNPHWHNRDRFILSAGHGSMLIYALLHLTGYDISLDDLKNFRQWGSKTPGHPEYREVPGVETTTGPLGQGASNAVGMALAEAFLAKHFNRGDANIVDHYTYAIVSDGDLMEGISIEAAALAGHWGLGKLTFLYDDNGVTLDGKAEMTFTENIEQRYQAQGWHTLRVADGNDIAAVNEALNTAKSITDKPSILLIRNIIGYGSPNKQGSNKAHGAALGVEEVKLTKENLGWDAEKFFYVPDAALNHWREAIDKGKAAEESWNQLYAKWKSANPELAVEYEQVFAGELPQGWDSDLPVYSDEKPIATRNALSAALNAIAPYIPTMIGGDADLAGSTKTLIKGEANTGHKHPTERNIRFGVREHAMGAIVNGLALHGGIIKPYSATFLTFSDYMRGSIRLGSLMKIPTLYLFTHDSIGVGEDGPTHQPVEHVMSLRLIPNLTVFRPGDANEMVGAWKTAMQLSGPAVIVGTRQNLAVLADNVAGIHEGVSRGAYILTESAKIKKGRPEVIIMATGSEVEIALEAFAALDGEGVKTRVVSMPSWELFDAQSEDYQEFVLPSDVRSRVSIEAGTTLGWGKYVGLDGISIGVDTFGTSAPYAKIYAEYGITSEAILEAVSVLVK
ncbi:MAG: transketolase [Anaerolineae bacterium]|nr:transketolase [Anaerolineae bacterium]MDQ7033819.1 transketolase [Anaerolineae bacterium]